MPAFVSRLEWIKNKGEGDTQIIDNWKTINIRISSELKSNRMTIKLTNDFGDTAPRKYNNSLGSIVGEGAFQIDDKFKLYAKYDSDNSGLDLSENSNDLVFFGDLRNLVSDVSENSKITLVCTDRTFNILNRIGWAAYRKSDVRAPNGQGWTAPLMVLDVVRQRSSTNKQARSRNQFIYDKDGHLTPSDTPNTEFLEIDARPFSEGGFVQDTRNITITKDGTSVSRTIGTTDIDTTLFPTGPSSTAGNNFPFQGFVKVGKPVYEMLQNLSQIDMTNTPDELDPASAFDPIIKRAMRYYIDEKMRLHWFYPIDNTFGTGDDTDSKDKFDNDLDITMGDDDIYETKRHKLTYDLFAVINFIYFEAGIDMTGNAILGFRYDPTSGAPNLKDSKRSYPSISKSMKLEDDIAKVEGGHISVNLANKSGYDFPEDYGTGIKPLWNTKVTVNSNAEYNQEFKNEARRQGNAKADSIIKGTSSQRWKGTMEFRFHNFTVTDLIRYTSEAGGLTKQTLRITDIAHNIQKAASFTTLTLEEDGKELEG